MPHLRRSSISPAESAQDNTSLNFHSNILLYFPGRRENSRPCIKFSLFSLVFKVRIERGIRSFIFPVCIGTVDSSRERTVCERCNAKKLSSYLLLALGSNASWKPQRDLSGHPVYNAEGSTPWHWIVSGQTIVG